MKGQLVGSKKERNSLDAQSSPSVLVVCGCVRAGVGPSVRGAQARGSDSQCQIACRALNNDCKSDATFPLSPGVHLANGVRAWGPIVPETASTQVASSLAHRFHRLGTCPAGIGRYPDGAKKARTVTQAGRLGQTVPGSPGRSSCRSCVINSARSSRLLDELACLHAHTRTPAEEELASAAPFVKCSSPRHDWLCFVDFFQKSPQNKTFTANPRPPDHTMGLAFPYRYR